jgi:WD40 repeat protein
MLYVSRETFPFMQMTPQPPDPSKPEFSQPAPDSEPRKETPSLSQGLGRLAGVILVLIVIARGLIFIIGRVSPQALGPESANNPGAKAIQPASGNLSPEPSIAPQLAISAANVERIAALATWGQGALRAAYFAPDGSQFALLTALDLKLYDAATYQLLRSYPIKSDNVAVAISPDWQKFAVGDGNALNVYRLEDGQALLTLQGSSGQQTSPAFSPDGSLLASVALPPGGEARTGSVELWRLSDGKLLNSWEAGAGALAFSPSGKLLATWNAMTGIRVWGLPNGTLLSQTKGAPIAVLFLPDGQTLVAADMNGKIQRYRAADGSQVDTIAASSPATSTLRLAPDGQTLAGLAGNGQISLWRLPQGQPLSNLKIQTNPGGVFAFLPNNNQMLTTLKDQVIVWNLANGQQKTILSGFYPSERNLAFLGGGKGLASLSDGGMDGAASLQVRAIPDGRTQCGVDDLSALSLAASPTMQDGGRIALGGSDGSILLLRASDCFKLKTAKAYLQQVQDVSFAPVDPLLVTSSMDAVQVIYYREPFQIMGFYNTPGGWVTPVRFNQHGNAIAAVSADGTISVWDYPVGRSLYKLQVSAQGYPASLAFSPDDAQLLAGAQDHIQVWRTSDGKPIADWDVKGEIQSLAVSPDGSLLAVGLADGQVQLRSLVDGRLLRLLQAQNGPLSDLAISPDGRYLASSGQDGTVRLWGVLGEAP